MRWTLGLAAATAPVAVLHPAATAIALCVSASLALVTPRRVAACVLVVLLVAAVAGLRVDAAPRSPSSTSEARR